MKRRGAKAEGAVYPPEVLADEEPKYLRRQKPLEIKRRKFGRRGWKTYARIAGWTAAGVAVVCAARTAQVALRTSPELALLHPSQIEISPVRYVSRTSILEIFAPDRGRSILRIPIEKRRAEIEALPWVAGASVRRALPNRIQIEVTERVPVAFVRLPGSETALVDARGVILPLPREANFDFPVVAGLSAEMPAGERETRMNLFSAFTQQAGLAAPGALRQVSEVDVSDSEDLRATITGFAPAEGDPQTAPITVEFGDSGFGEKYRSLTANFAQWRAKAGRIESVDLRFEGEAIVNPASGAASLSAQQQASK